VLVVTTKGEIHKNSLLNCAKTMDCRSMFYFATMEEVKSANLFTDPVFTLPDGQKTGLIYVRKERKQKPKITLSLSPPSVLTKSIRQGCAHRF
jgi:hypothetical protein